MRQRRFEEGTEYRQGQTVYRITEVLANGVINIIDCLTGEHDHTTQEVLVNAFFAGDVHFCGPHQHSAHEAQHDEDITDPRPSLAEYDPVSRAIILYRRWVIEPYVKTPRQQRTRQLVIDRVQLIQQALPLVPLLLEIQDEIIPESTPIAHIADLIMLKLRGEVDCDVLAAALELTAVLWTSGCTDFSSKHLQKISVASFYRWCKEFLTAECDEQSLAPDFDMCGVRTYRLDATLEEFITQAMHNCASQGEIVTIDDVTNEVARLLKQRNQALPETDHLDPPHRSTISRRLLDGDVEAHRLALTDPEARRKSRQSGKIPIPKVPLEEAEMDATRIDFIVLDDRDDLPLGRMHAMWCLDRATRYPLGFYLGFEPPSYYSVMACLFHTICPKEDIRKRYGTDHQWIAYGKMGKLIVDNAKYFIGNDLIDACRQLNIVLEFAPVRTPEFKALIERLFRTFNTMLFHQLPGTTFSNPQQRGAYDSTAQACIYLSQVDQMVHTFIVDQYAERFHMGLRGIPARRWERALELGFFPTFPESADHLRILLSRVAERTVQHYGIDFLWLRYNCEALGPLRRRLKTGEKVRIKYHPGDLSAIHVWDPFQHCYLRVPALDQDYTQHLSLWKHKIIVRATLAEQKRVDRAGLGRARYRLIEDTDLPGATLKGDDDGYELTFVQPWAL
jgi:transposase InsO family protein